MTAIQRRLCTALVLFVLAAPAPWAPRDTAEATVSVAVRGLSQLIDEALNVAAKVSGKALGKAERALALGRLRDAALRYGDDALFAARKGGIELIDAAARHGDDVWRFASKVPSGARALAMRTDELLPLARRMGPEVLEIEARSPGLARHVVGQFGDDAIRYFARSVPQADASKLLGYAAKADSPGTRALLLETYKKGGTRFLEKLDWKHIMATGLSVAMITAAYQTTDGIQEGLKALPEKSPEVFKDTVTHFFDRITLPIVWPAMILGCGLALIWLLRYALRGMRKDRKQAAGAERVRVHAEREGR